MKYYLIALLILTGIVLSGCTNERELQLSKDPNFCYEDTDCRKYTLNWPCDVAIANTYAKLIENIPDDRDKPIGLSQQFCEWSYKDAICSSSKCVSKVNCERAMPECNQCNTVGRETVERLNPGHSEYEYWTAMCTFCETYCI